MARTTAGKLVSKTAAAAKKVTASVAKRAAPAAKEPAEPTKRSATTGKAPAGKRTTAAQKAPTPAKKGAPAAKRAAAAATKPATDGTPTKKPATKKTAAKKPAAKKTATKQTAGKKTAAKQVAAKSTPTKKTATKRLATKKPVAASSLKVKADEQPWTTAELDEVRSELDTDVARLRDELDLATRELDDLMRDAGDGAGNDQADVGSTTFERDHEMTLANNARVMLVQTEHALERIADGSYGVCESCGQPIGKNRLIAFPRATLCLTCKQHEERR